MTESEKKKEFLKLYDEVHEPLLRFARAMTRNSDDARDIAAETILKAYENFDKVKSSQAFLSYLFSIATRIHKRRRWRLRIFGQYDETKAEQLTANIASPDLGADVEILYKTLDKIPEKMKETVVLFEISGLSLEEIREIQGGTLSGVKTRLSRGRELLKKLLGAEKKSYKLQNSTDEMNEISSEIYSKNETVEAGII